MGKRRQRSFNAGNPLANRRRGCFVTLLDPITGEVTARGELVDVGVELWRYWFGKFNYSPDGMTYRGWTADGQPVRLTIMFDRMRWCVGRVGSKWVTRTLSQ